MADEHNTLLSKLLQYLTPPVQIFLVVAVVLAVKRFWKKKVVEEEEDPAEPPLEPMGKRDFTLAELREFDGKVNPRILIAVNGKVFDVTKGKGFYGPDGPYNVFAGRDATRGLATFSIDASSMRNEYDDLSDLNSMQMESVVEWEMQFMEKYDMIGKLIRDGEAHTNYKADESEDERDAKKPAPDKKTD